MLYPLLTYIAPDGRQIDFQCEGSTIARSIMGLSDVEGNFQLIKTPFRHGSSLVSGVAKERMISVPIYLTDTGDLSYRQRLAYWSGVLNAFKGEPGEVELGTLRYQGYKDAPVYEIGALPIGKPDIKKSMPTWTTRIFDFLCPNPFFRQTPIGVASSSISESGFDIPWSVPTSITTGSTSIEMWNYGDVPSPAEIEIKGPATDIWIRHQESNALMRIFITLGADDTLLIDGENRTVTVEGVNVAGFLSTDSMFIACQIGRNTFDVAVDQGTPSVTIRSYSLVTGVN